ncbi:MAG: MarR family transcriptional regulator [Erythrobacter sp.]|nr:MarR family transcriptional regulator [Erythrobacter sp.]
MAQADFDYFNTGQTGELSKTVSILADSDLSRAQWFEDAALAGLRIVHLGPLSDWADGDEYPLGNVVLVECDRADAAALAALTRLDLLVERAGAELLVATCVVELDDVFACLDRARPHILVDPSRGERVVALGRVMARGAHSRLRELAEDERLVLLRLTEQVAEIAERLERMGRQGLAADGSAFRFESPKREFRGEADDVTGGHLRPSRPSLPDPRLVRQIIQQRQMRARFFDGALFADPAWDMLLDLTASRAEHVRVSVTSLCIASGVPPTTALRWIGQMVDAGLFVRTEDGVDKRRAFIALSDQAAEAMARYFAELGKAAAKLV